MGIFSGSYRLICGVLLTSFSASALGFAQDSKVVNLNKEVATRLNSCNEFSSEAVEESPCTSTTGKNRQINQLEKKYLSTPPFSAMFLRNLWHL